MAIHWITAFLDFPDDRFAEGVAYWRKVTGTEVSEPWGSEREFATLVHSDGDPYLCVQRLRDGESGSHPDFHVTDLEAETARARRLGATSVLEKPGLSVFTSPAGAPFCFVRHKGSQRDTPPPRTWSGGQRSRLDQICIDIPPDEFDAELAFWRELTGWPRSSTDVLEFRRLLPPPGLPLHFLLQRLEHTEPSRKAGAHMDFSSTDVDLETARHVALGARPLDRHPRCQIMRDPTGLVYCITGKDPDGSWLASTGPME